MRCDDLIGKNLLTPQIASLLFEERRRNMAIRASSYPSIAFNAGLLYTVLVQAFVLARSAKSGIALAEKNYPSLLLENVRYTWTVDGTKQETHRTGKLWVFSFLIQCAAGGASPLFSANAAKAVTTVKNAVLKTEDNSRHFSDLLTEEELLTYLSALPLLGSTEIDWENMQFVFHTADGEIYPIDCRPFLCFWNEKKNEQSHARTASCYAITCVRKGKQMGELCVSMMPLNCTDPEIPTKQTYWKASKNETVRMIFQALEIPTDWLATENCWCDLEFMSRLANAAEEILAKYWKLRKSDLDRVCVREQFAGLFGDEKIKKDILGKGNRKLLLSGIDKVLFGLFINHGIFKTMRELFEDTEDEKNVSSGASLFELFLNAFEAKKYIAAKKKQQILEECANEIRRHVAALRVKVPYENSPQFKRRSLEITAEWRAYSVLKAAGIRADNLFADRESIYSIDDYFNMLQNPRTSVKEDLGQVLTLLLEIYGALLENCPITEDSGVRVNEEEFYAAMHRIRKECEALSLEERFHAFLETVKKAEDHRNVQSLLGRSGICKVENVANFKADILDAISNEQEDLLRSEPDFDFNQRYIFISYSHKDSALIEPFLTHWKSLGWQIYIDKERFYAGAPWVSAALNAIRNPNCALVAVFASENSLVSNAVANELACAKEVAESRFGKGTELADRFILPINLNPDMQIQQMLRHIQIHAKEKQHASIAMELSEIITGVDIFRTVKDLNDSAFDEEIRKMLTHQPAEDSKMRDVRYTDLEMQIAKFYTFLKYGDGGDWAVKDIDTYFHGKSDAPPPLSHCIYPIVASMKETKIHRDNITMVGYEMVTGSAERKDRTNYILTTKPLSSPDDYYCIPHEARVGEDCSWMADPLLISYKRATEK